MVAPFRIARMDPVRLCVLSHSARFPVAPQRLVVAFPVFECDAEVVPCRRHAFRIVVFFVDAQGPPVVYFRAVQPVHLRKSRTDIAVQETQPRSGAVFFKISRRLLPVPDRFLQLTQMIVQRAEVDLHLRHATRVGKGLEKANGLHQLFGRVLKISLVHAGNAALSQQFGAEPPVVFCGKRPQRPVQEAAAPLRRQGGGVEPHPHDRPRGCVCGVFVNFADKIAQRGRRHGKTVVKTRAKGECK